MACGLLSAFSSPLCQVPGSPARFTQYFSVLGSHPPPHFPLCCHHLPHLYFFLLSPVSHPPSLPSEPCISSPFSSKESCISSPFSSKSTSDALCFWIYLRCLPFFHLVETKEVQVWGWIGGHLLQTSPINLEQPMLQGQHDVEARTWLHQRPLASSELSSSFPLLGTGGTCSVWSWSHPLHPQLSALPGLLDDASPLSCLLSPLHFTFFKLKLLQYCFCFVLGFWL